MSQEREFIPLNLALMTISDSRTEADDKSGAVLHRMTTEAGHHIHEQCIVRDDMYQIRATVSRWIADPGVHAVITTGGTGPDRTRWHAGGGAPPAGQGNRGIRRDCSG